MAFKLASAFVEFTARTEQAVAGMKAVEQQAEQTATQMDTQMAAAGTSVSAFVPGMAVVGTIAATRFAAGIGEGIKAGATFKDTVEAGFSSLLGMKSHLERVAEGAALAKGVMEKLQDAIAGVDKELDQLTHAPKPEFAAFGEKGSAALEKELADLAHARNDAFRKAVGEGKTVGPLSEINNLKSKIAVDEGKSGIVGSDMVSRARIKEIEEANHKILDAATAADAAYRAKLAEVEEANRKASAAQFLGRTGLGLAKDARDVGVSAISSARADFAAARDGIGPLGFLGRSAAGVEAMINEGMKGKKELEDLKERQGAGDVRFAGVQAIGDRFKKQIEDVEADMKRQRQIEHDDPVRKNREAADAKITADKELIDQLRDQEAEEKRRFQNTAEFATGLKKSWDNIAKIANKSFGWGP